MKNKKSNDSPVMATAGIWKDMKETGEEYQRRLRKGWRRRLKKQYMTFFNISDLIVRSPY